METALPWRNGIEHPSSVAHVQEQSRLPRPPNRLSAAWRYSYRRKSGKVEEVVDRLSSRMRLVVLAAQQVAADVDWLRMVIETWSPCRANDVWESQRVLVTLTLLALLTRLFD